MAFLINYFCCLLVSACIFLNPLEITQTNKWQHKIDRGLKKLSKKYDGKHGAYEIISVEMTPLGEINLECSTGTFVNVQKAYTKVIFDKGKKLDEWFSYLLYLDVFECSNINEASLLMLRLAQFRSFRDQGRAECHFDKPKFSRRCCDAIFGRGNYMHFQYKNVVIVINDVSGRYPNFFNIFKDLEAEISSKKRDIKPKEAPIKFSWSKSIDRSLECLRNKYDGKHYPIKKVKTINTYLGELGLACDSTPFSQFTESYTRRIFVTEKKLNNGEPEELKMDFYACTNEAEAKLLKEKIDLFNKFLIKEKDTCALVGWDYNTLCCDNLVYLRPFAYFQYKSAVIVISDDSRINPKFDNISKDIKFEILKH